jgi:hypothetical protein
MERRFFGVPAEVTDGCTKVAPELLERRVV